MDDHKSVAQQKKCSTKKIGHEQKPKLQKFFLHKIEKKIQHI